MYDRDANAHVVKKARALKHGGGSEQGSGGALEQGSGGGWAKAETEF